MRKCNVFARVCARVCVCVPVSGYTYGKHTYEITDAFAGNAFLIFVCVPVSSFVQFLKEWL